MPRQIIEVVQHLRQVVLRQGDAALTDGRLLGRFVEQRDQTALAALMQRHGAMVWGVCRRMLNHHDAEDAFQATFLVLVRRAASVAPREMVGNWLYGVAHQTALKARAMGAKRLMREKQGAAMPDIPAPTECTGTDLHVVLDQELSRLPDKYRVAVVLCDLQGQTHKEAARQLGLSEGTVTGRVMRARAMLAKRLARHGFAWSATALASVLTQQVALATVPDSVMRSACKVVTAVAAGQVLADAASGTAAALAAGVLRTMWLAKLKIATALVLLLAVGGIAWESRLLRTPAEPTVEFTITPDSPQETQRAHHTATTVPEVDQVPLTFACTLPESRERTAEFLEHLKNIGCQ